MGEGFIVRRGGGGAITKAPSINFVSSTFNSITFTITNNDALTADIFWEIGDSTPDANTLSLASGATSSNQVASGLTELTSYTIFAFANAAGKAGSQTSSIAQTTPLEPVVYTAATGGTTNDYDSGGKRYRSHTFTSNGTFTVTTVGNVNYGGVAVNHNQVNYLIIGGGSGGNGGVSSVNYGNGGAAGVARTGTTTVNSQTYSVSVGSGSPGGGQSNSTNGTQSSFNNVIATGGNGSSRTGRTGASNADFTGGTNGSGVSSGGGAGSGANGSGSVGGNGVANSLRTGSNETRGGGGGGVDGSTGASGGSGGGGAGSPSSAASGVANTGSGGGGGPSNLAGGSGGSGIVIIRYEIAPTT